ncbi:hypothetical protein KKB44_04955 [Candidatus Micrarchaeota archaeon]|nr:hypothetical protein [Candidatus Micrarchaeota archaeon]
MKYFALIIVFGILIFGCLGGEEKILNAESKEYNIKGFRFTCPATWESEQKEWHVDNENITCKSEDGMGRIRIRIFDGPALSPDEIADETLGSKAIYIAMGGTFEKPTMKESELNGIPAFEGEYLVDASDDNFDQIGKIFVISCNNTLFGIDVAAQPEEFESNWNKYEEVLDTIDCEYKEEINETEEEPTEPEEEILEQVTEENETEELEFEPISETGCWEFGDVRDPETATYVIYTKGTYAEGHYLVRWDDHCRSENEVVKKYCPVTGGGIAASNMTECPAGTKCLDGACIDSSEYESAEICKDLEGGDRSISLCDGYTFTHSSGIGMTPNLIVYNTGVLHTMIMHLTGAEEEMIDDGDFMEQEIHSDSGRTVFLKVIGAGWTQENQSSYVLLQIWTEGGINPSELEGGVRIR